MKRILPECVKSLGHLSPLCFVAGRHVRSIRHGRFHPDDELPRAATAGIVSVERRSTMTSNYTVGKNGDQWSAQRDGASRAASNHDTQADAIAAARALARNAGGGEVTIKGVDGKIRAKDTVPKGNDPRDIPG
jgi:hypothetical protein